MSNFNDIKGKVHTINLGGQEFTLRYDLNAYGELEKRYGSVEDALNLIDEKNMSAIKVVLWAGLIHNHAVLDEITGEPIKYTITPYQVGSLILPSMFKDVIMGIMNAITDTLPEESKQKVAAEIAKIEQESIDPKQAQVVLTAEEKKQLEAEQKNA